MVDIYDTRIFKCPEDAFVSAGEHSDQRTLKKLLEIGVSIDCRDSTYGDTALHRAASVGSTPTVAFLLDRGASIDALDGNSMTPLMCACSKGKKKGSAVALYLLERGASATYVRTEDGMTALKFALWGQCLPTVVSALVGAGAEPPGPDFRIVHLT